MNFKYDGKKFQGTRAEILKQIEIAFPFEIVNGNFRRGNVSMPCNFNYTYLDAVKNTLIKRIQDQVPQEIYDVRIGNDIYHGTKEEIEHQFITNIKGIDIIFMRENRFELLGVSARGYSGDTFSIIRDKIIGNVKRLIYDL